jgi:hypothetical protein
MPKVRMAEYQLYPVDKGGQVGGPPKIFSCDSDEAAINLARYLVHGDVELWQLDRLVTRLPSMESTQSEVEAEVLRNIASSWSRLAGQIDRYSALVRQQGRAARK